MNIRSLTCLVALLVSTQTGAQAADQNFAVLLGFDSYSHLPDVPSQSRDVVTLATTLQQNCGVQNVLTLTQAASSETAAHDAQQVLTFVQRARRSPAAKLVIYLSGYAIPAGDADFVIALSGTDPAAQNPQGLRLSKLAEALADFPESTRILLLLDCCKQVTVDGDSVGATNDALLPMFAKSQALVAVAASGAGQQSHVTEAGDRGIFAEALNSAFLGKANLNDGTSITVRELFQHVYVEVQKAAAAQGFSQSPVIKTFGVLERNDIVLRYVPAKQLKIIQVTNQERGANSSLYLRHGLDAVTVPPGQTRQVHCESASEVTYYTGIPQLGRDGWQPIYEGPTVNYNFRAVRQASGRTAWVAGFVNSLGVPMVLVHPGSFRMGRNAQDQITFDMVNLNPAESDWPMENELPSHAVRITRPFYIGQHEVTVEQFDQFVRKAAYRSDAERKGATSGVYLDGEGESTGQEGVTWRSPQIRQTRNHPAVHLTWNDANRLCAFLSLKESAAYQLPTEAQWEYAARAGSQTTYWNGNVPEQLTQVANVRDAALRRQHPAWDGTLVSSDGYSDTAPVGSFRPNPFGLYDTSGNVWEWCADWYDASYYRSSPASDPTGPPEGEAHVYRGGCFY